MYHQNVRTLTARIRLMPILVFITGFLGFPVVLNTCCISPLSSSCRVITYILDIEKLYNIVLQSKNL